MRIGRAVETINRLRRQSPSGVKSKSLICARNIFVDGLRNANDVNTLFRKTSGNRLSPVTAKAYQGIKLQLAIKLDTPVR